MTFGYHLLAWRRQKGLSQGALAEKAGVPRPYLSRLERNQADPSLSMLHRLAASLELTAGQLIDDRPPVKALDRFEMDDLARSSLNQDRRSRLGDNSYRRLRVQLGEDQWKALLRRMQKHAAYLEHK